jgi:hypothetical protein
VNLPATMPDLTAGAPNSTTGTAGNPVTLTGSVSNIGTGPAGGFSSIFQVQNGTLTDATYTGSLAAGAGPSPLTGSYTFPSAGTYNVRTCVDADTSWTGTVAESNENNNCSGWTPITITAATGADLTVSNVSPTTFAASASSRQYSATVTNGGNAASTAGAVTVFRYSSNPSGVPATTLGTSSAAAITQPGQSYLATVNSAAITTPGTYYIRTCTDATFVVAESNDNNNCSGWVTVTVTSSAVNANLIVSNVIASTTANGNIAFSATVSNIGGAATPGSFYTLFEMASTSSGTNKVNINVHQLGGVLAQNANRQVTVPGGTPNLGIALSPGTIYVRAFVDDNNQIDEGGPTYENDNYSAWTPITITGSSAPNLTAGAATSNPASPASGTSGAVLSSTITNNGTAPTGSGFNTIFQVANDSLGTGATYIGMYSSVGSLPSSGGNTLVATLPYTFPSAGTFYIRACADNNGSFVGSVTESDEGDNCGAWNAVTVTQGTMPNLVAGTVTLNPAAPSSGSPTTLSATITNSGTVTAANVQNIFQIENGPLIQATSGPITVTAGGNQAVNASYQFPGVGTYRVRACADSNTSWTGTINESNEGDNCGPWKSVTIAGASVSCTVNKQTALLGDTVTYTAVPSTGVTAPYAWTASDGASGLGTAITASRIFSTAGTYAMQVTGTGASAPGFCPNVQAGAGACGVLTSATITATPARISSGGTAQISWNATGVSGSCTISGPGITTTISAADASCNTSSATMPLTTPALTSQAIYTIDCNGIKSTAIVNVVPAIKEI